MIANKEYHGVEIENWTIPKNVLEWLDKNVGEGHWFIKGTIGGQTIYFDDERKHFLFLLTWGQRG